MIARFFQRDSRNINNGKTSKIQIASIFTVCAILIGGIGDIQAEEQKPDIKKVIKEISKELREYVKDESPLKEDESTKIQEIKSEYSDKLDTVFELVLSNSNIDYSVGTDLEKDTFLDSRRTQMAKNRFL